MHSPLSKANSRQGLEAKVLAAAFRQSFERGDSEGVTLVHKHLCQLLQELNAETLVDKEATVLLAQAELNKAPVPMTTIPEESKNTAEVACDEDKQEANPSPALILTNNLYTVLGISSSVSFAEIHKQFLKKVRSLLRTLLRRGSKARQSAGRECRNKLRMVCLAHDILKDPTIRAEYDSGLLDADLVEQNYVLPTKTEPTAIHLKDNVKDSAKSFTKMKIGELLEHAHILEPAELEIALDMHKALPELPFGQYLVKAGFLNQQELDGALYGQHLVGNGQITIEQFEKAMLKTRKMGIPLFETLIVEGWIEPSDMFDEKSDLWQQPDLSPYQAAPAPKDPVLSLPPPYTPALTPQELAVQIPEAWTLEDTQSETQTFDLSLLKGLNGDA